MPCGKIIKEFVFDLPPFITSGIGGASTGHSDDDLDLDEEFVPKLTLSRFRKDLMEVAQHNFQRSMGWQRKVSDVGVNFISRSNGTCQCGQSYIQPRHSFGQFVSRWQQRQE